ncbi:HupE/UreJ family protein [Aromatoleum toluclasticum]|uniref:HupE/UreJ family protein n=1 Tax=Aromatoleum toluclasticum TaxID=92003 RepID=UPI001D1811AE|nr:HupE/UreJ family protein [Aromatoleum toluclasticum]MCC4114780.1 HupE/UreJ family protein [Aromatoleum toluclasticum]
MKRLRNGGWWLLLAFWTGIAFAHDSRPVYLELSQSNPLSFSGRLQVPTSLAVDEFPVLEASRECAVAAQGGIVRSGEAYVQKIAIECASEARDFVLTLKYPKGNPSLSTLVRYTASDGAQHTEILPPDGTTWQPLADRHAGLPVLDYLGVGVQHILSGYDHLLFVACLVWIAGTRRRILITVTGFTVSHSVTLALAAFDVVQLPTPPLEATIALSIVFLACELVKERRDSLTWKYPVAVSTAFGLVHGFAFATALSDIGLPRGEMALSLFLFNLGVEAGQIAVVLLLWWVQCVDRRFRVSGRLGWALTGARLEKSLGYVIGSLASVMLLSRLVAFGG